MDDPQRGPPWGWTRATRRLLVFVALGAALSLWRHAPTANAPADHFQAAPVVLDIDPNTAPLSALMALPRVGPTLADRIVKEREAGPFASPRDLERRVKGIGPATIAALEPYLRFEPGAPAPEAQWTIAVSAPEPTP